MSGFTARDTFRRRRVHANPEEKTDGSKNVFSWKLSTLADRCLLMLLLMLLVSLSDDDSSCLLAHTGRRRAARARWRPSEDSPPSPPPAALNQTSQQTVIHRPYLPLRGQLLPALRVPDGGVVRGEVRVRELQLSAVGAGTAASALRLDVLQTLAGVGVHLVAVQEDLALETLAQELRVGGGSGEILGMREGGRSS